MIRARRGAADRSGHGRLPVRLILFGGFSAIALAVAAYAAWSVAALGDAGRIVDRTYDRSLMALNYARAAEANTVRLLAAAPDGRAALYETVLSDLSVARDRAPGEGSAQADAMTRMIEGWRADGVPDDASASADDAFLILSELLAADAYIEREDANAAVEASQRLARYGIAAIAVSALLLSAFLSHVLVSPLRAAAGAARQITDGHFDAALPKGRTAEVVDLLASMGVMQASIARMVEAEKSARLSAEARLGTAVAHAPDGIVLLDAEGRVLLANVQAETLLGTRIEEGAPLDDVLEEIGVGADARLSLSLGGEEKLPSGRWVRLTVGGGEETGDGGRIAIWSDITPLKDREAALAAANAAKTRFIATISHELKTPLNAVIGFSDLLKDEAMGPLGDESYVEFAASINDAGSKLLGIISDILTYANAQDADYRKGGSVLDVAEIARDAAETARGYESFAGRELRLDLPKGPARALCEPSVLKRGLCHLLDNAGHFSPDGGVVTLSVTQSEGRILIGVADEGPGMSPEQLDTAQGAFDQVDGSLTRNHEGVGLGLALARSVAEGHGGRLRLESTLGEGTFAAIELAAAQQKVAA